jgi:hypothetical protein
MPSLPSTCAIDLRPSRSCFLTPWSLGSIWSRRSRGFDPDEGSGLSK